MPGSVRVYFWVAGSTGEVVRVAASSDPSGAANCVLTIASTVRFPRFRRPELRVSYPYHIGHGGPPAR